MGTEEPDFLLRMILEKLDQIDQKIGGHSEKFASHEVRLSTLENSKKDNRATWLAFTVAALAWVPNLIQLIGK